MMMIIKIMTKKIIHKKMNTLKKMQAMTILKLIKNQKKMEKKINMESKIHKMIKTMMKKIMQTIKMDNKILKLEIKKTMDLKMMN